MRKKSIKEAVPVDKIALRSLYIALHKKTVMVK